MRIYVASRTSNPLVQRTEVVPLTCISLPALSHIWKRGDAGEHSHEPLTSDPNSPADNVVEVE